RRIVIGALAAAAAVALTSCSVGPNYHRPPQRMPTTYKSVATQPSMAPTTVPALSADWWRLFGDADLRKLEEAALAASPTLGAAMARVQEARAAARIAGAQFYPVITLDPSWQRGRTPLNPTINNSASSRTGNTQTVVR